MLKNFNIEMLGAPFTSPSSEKDGAHHDQFNNLSTMPSTSAADSFATLIRLDNADG